MRISKAIKRSFAPRIEQVFHILSRGPFLQSDAKRGLTAPLESHQLLKIESCLEHNTLVGVQMNRSVAQTGDRLRVSRRKSIILNNSQNNAQKVHCFDAPPSSS